MTKIKKNLIALLLGAGVIGGAITSSTFAFDDHDHDNHAKKGQHSDDLEEYMEELDASMKKIRRSLKKASSNADSLSHLEKMQLATVHCKSLVPEMGHKLKGQALKQMTSGYRIKMAEQLILLAQIEIEVLKGDNKKAAKMYKGLTKMKKAGHKAYIEDE